MNRTTIAAAAAAALALTACGGSDADTNADLVNDSTPIVETDGGAPRATATLTDSAGNDVGTVTLERADGGVQIRAELHGVAPGDHGIHVHMVGQCDAAGGFASAGGHLNPTGAHHGLENPQGPHLGDMPNLTVGDDSTGTLTFTNDALRLDAEGNLQDADGAAIVLHADADDQTSDPSGNSGARVACGVMRAG